VQNASDYTAAGTLPAKVIRLAGQIYSGGALRPVHVQISPTNVCQLDCGFCSCANRANDVEMPYKTYYGIMQTFAQYGCKAATITGGGEPTLHPKIDDILHATKTLGIQAGMVTNGLSLDRVRGAALRTLTWCRVSFSDDRPFDQWFAEKMEKAVRTAPSVGWAFSYVVTRDANIDNIAKVVDFANGHGFTHVRLVTDLLDLDGAGDMAAIKKGLAKANVDDGLVIYQGRKEFTKGRKNCWVSLVKPVIAADGAWYPCCGVQYALDNPGKDFEPSMCMGQDHRQIIGGQVPFDGSACKRCYYDNYNVILDALARPHEHEVFV